MWVDRLREHVKLCRRNLRSAHVKCCATCPFEPEIVTVYPDMAELFNAKRAALESRAVSCDDDC